MNIRCYVPVTLLLERWLHIEVVEDVAKASMLVIPMICITRLQTTVARLDTV